MIKYYSKENAITAFKAFNEDGDTIKEDTWYTYCNGKPVKGICQIDQID